MALALLFIGFDQSVIDFEFEIIQDALLMSSKHPGEIPQWFEPAVCGPPEPPFQVFGGPSFAFVSP